MIKKKSFITNDRLNKLYKDLSDWQKELTHNRNGLRQAAPAKIAYIRQLIKIEINLIELRKRGNG